MARADTFEMDKGGYDWSMNDGCAICGQKAESNYSANFYRAFYYPTYMNGDAEWLGDYCKQHKGTKLADVCNGKIAVRYELPEFPNAKVLIK